MATTTRLRIQLLGAFRVQVGDQTVPLEAWRSRRASALVKLLALSPAFRFPREQIAEILWPELDFDAQMNNLNVATTRARGALIASGAVAGEFLTRDAGALVLGPAAVVGVDVIAFERGVAEGWRTLDPAVCHAALTQYTGDLLPDDPYETWLELRRTALRSQFLALLARLARLHEERSEFNYAVNAWQRLVTMEPADEAAHVSLMRLYDRLGQHQQALAQYDQLVANLRVHLDAEPHHDTVEFVRALRAAGPMLPHRPVRLVVPATDTPSPHIVPPLPLDDLIGREREIAEVRTRLVRGRLVTLTGPGGIGKTRLALAVAHELIHAQPSELTDEVVFVDLAPVVDPAHVVSAIARAARVDSQAGFISFDAMINLFTPRRSLIVLDNFEQVIDAASVVARLLEHAHGCQMLVTSRVPLRVRGEIEFPVRPLPLPTSEDVVDLDTLMSSPATALFMHRALNVKPDFSVNTTQAVAIAGVCRLLDGLPLAIELAAARVKVLSPSTILARLDRPLALLSGGNRDLPARQRTMRDTIAWSYELLSSAEQRLFRRLGVFVGGWTLEMAEAVIDPDGDLGMSVLDGLASLIDKNLVIRRDDEDGGARFGLLETVREFAVEQLTLSTDAPVMHDHHATYMVTFAEQSVPHLEGSELPRWMRHLDNEDSNLRAARQWLWEQRDAERALRLLTALRLYLFIRGRLAEGCDDLLAVAEMPEAASVPALRIDALIAAAFFAREYGDYDRAAAASAEARVEADRIGDSARTADALINLGYVALQRGDRQTAQHLFEESLRRNQDLKNAQGIADARSFLGLTAYYEDDLPAARRLTEESLEIWEALNDRQAIVWAQTRLGSVLIRQGAVAEASAQFVAALAISRELDFRWGYAWSFDGLAHIAARQGDIEVARELTTVAAAIRAASTLRLPPIEDEEITRLHQDLGLRGGMVAKRSLTTNDLRRRIEDALERVQQSFSDWILDKA